ncbi:glycine betaine/proline transport system ATP-binding protein [Oceanospirillum multiglobuliferum]|uniref:Choline ABC transporter ATP-binding protein n=1 Tax=Oceanospirillum multiglobuliferum TaxID=64969 RepID=A0A1T4MJN9_9GAMM|nr:choline ABC transporter ATP-binding protein [Oceanospirillum multiglobuliferum]OPX57004.1 choline ABC transporter ATP-binding protein [Oceanospirillum multiglobuliferum]SJZ66974.1 glycine betaine/proline transport system ATP-binding protein [Oceanospirillum multiglobuliferum]
MNVINIENLDVVFGDPQQQTQALALLDQGLSRQEIIEQTGAVVGVQNANIRVQEGEICVLMGLSGSGKSSLLRAINGLNSISRGKLEVKDGNETIDLANCDENTLRHLRTNRISMVFQKFALMPWLTVLENVAFGLEMKGIDKKERHNSALEKLEMVGLSEWANALPHELSGGMQQRVGLARAFAMDSDILLMDEPFSALDPLIRAQLQDELLELQRNLKKTIVFVSHDLDEALKIGSHIAIMESAKIIQHGEPEQIVLNPETAYVEDFVAHTNPLNVLGGRTLMSQKDQLKQEGERIIIDQNHQYWVQLAQGRIVQAGKGDTPLNTQTWQEGDATRGTFAIASPDINMRDAINLRYSSRLPVLLVENEQFVGVLNDSNFYYALLGKHFVAD